MARKSRQLRISQTSSLMRAYEAEDLQGDYRYRFLADVSRRLSLNKSLSPKQRSWLDSLIEEGAPKIDRNDALVQRIREASNLPGMSHRQSVLTDFLSRVALGKSLSDKQTSFLNAMLEEAENIKINGPYLPTEEVQETLRNCVKLGKSYSTVYWHTHPGTYKALMTVSAWLEEPVSKSIDEWSVNKIKKAMAAKLRELKTKPYVSPGAMVWVRLPNSSCLEVGVVTGHPRINDEGYIVYDVLSSGTVVSLVKEKIAKRNSQKYGG